MGNDANKETPYSLVLEGKGVTIKKEVPESIALQIISLAMGGQASGRVVLPKTTSNLTSVTGGTRISVREFMNHAGAKRNPEKIVAIGAYLIEELGQETFTRKDVKMQFMNAREPIPGNYTRDFDWAVSNGWLARTQGSAMDHYVTHSGLEAIKNQFSEEIRKTTKLKLPRRRSSRKQQAGPNNE